MPHVALPSRSALQIGMAIALAISVAATSLTATGAGPAAAQPAGECAQDPAGDAVDSTGATTTGPGDVAEVCADFDGERIRVTITTHEPADPAASPVYAAFGIGDVLMVYEADATSSRVTTTWLDPDGRDNVVCEGPAVAEGGGHVLGPLDRSCFNPPFLVGSLPISDTRCLSLSPIQWRSAEAADTMPESARLFLGNWEYGAVDAAGRPDDIGPVEAADPHVALHGVRHDGAASTWRRVDHGNPAFAAVAISRGRYPHAHEPLCFNRAPGYVVLARSDVFADALAGAALTWGGPLLFSEAEQTGGVTAGEIDRLLEPGDVVYLLGGTSALGPQVQADLEARGYVVRRLAGDTRVETALEIADEVLALGGTAEEVAVARSTAAGEDPTTAWADAVAGGGLAAVERKPLLLTPTDGLHPGVAEWLDAHATARTLLLGGEAALSPAVEAAVPDPVRLAGPDRAATAVAVARRYLARLPAPVVLVNGRHPDGWAYALPAAGISADEFAPLLLVEAAGVPPATLEHLRSDCGAFPRVDPLLIGGAAVIADTVPEQLEAVDPDCST